MTDEYAYTDEHAYTVYQVKYRCGCGCSFLTVATTRPAYEPGMSGKHCPQRHCLPLTHWLVEDPTWEQVAEAYRL